MLQELGFVEVRVGAACDTFGGASGEKKARLFEVYGYPFYAQKPN
jgi:arsenite methyltransferase